MEGNTIIHDSILERIHQDLTEIKALLKSGSEIKKDWLNEIEAQNKLGIKSTKLWSLRSSGFIKSSKIGRKTFYSRESIENFLKSNSK